MANAQNLMGTGFSAGAANQLVIEMQTGATATTPGALIMQPSIPNIAGVNPTQAEYNALLAALRLARVLAAP